MSNAPAARASASANGPHAFPRVTGRALAVVGIVSLAGAGCSASTPGQAGPQPPPLSVLFQDTAGTTTFAPDGATTFDLRTPGQRDMLHAAIRRQRERWRVLGLRDYRLLFRAACFCPGNEGWLALEIRDGQVLRIWNPRGKSVPVTDRNNYSIDGLFELLDQQADRIDVVQVGFDEQWHFPTYIRTDLRVGLPDDWGIIQVRGFRPDD